MKYSDFEKSIYKNLFERYKAGEHHVSFFKSEYDGDFEALRAAVKHLFDEDVLFLLANDPEELCVELDPDYCNDFVDL